MTTHCFSTSDTQGTTSLNSSFFYRRNTSLEEVGEEENIRAEYSPSLNLAHFLDHLPYECCRGAEVGISLRAKRTVSIPSGRRVGVVTLSYITSQHRRWTAQIEKSACSGERTDLKDRKIVVEVGPLSPHFLGNVVVMIENRSSVVQNIFGGQGLAKLAVKFCSY